MKIRLKFTLKIRTVVAGFIFALYVLEAQEGKSRRLEGERNKAKNIIC